MPGAISVNAIMALRTHKLLSEAQATDLLLLVRDANVGPGCVGNGGCVGMLQDAIRSSIQSGIAEFGDRLVSRFGLSIQLSNSVSVQPASVPPVRRLQSERKQSVSTLCFEQLKKGSCSNEPACGFYHGKISQSVWKEVKLKFSKILQDVEVPPQGFSD